MELQKLEQIANSYGKTVNFLHSWSILPFVWCKKSKKLILKSNRKIVSTFQFTLVAFSVIFLIFQNCRAWLNGRSSFFQRLHLLFTTFVFLSYAMFMVVLLKNAPVVLVNSMLDVVQNIYGRYFLLPLWYCIVHTFKRLVLFSRK